MSDSVSLKVTEVELVYRNKSKASERPIVKTSKDAYNIFYSTWDLDKIELQEQFRVMLLDRKSSVLAVTTLSTGGVSSCVVDLKLAFAAAIKGLASSIIIAHNHPSGNLKPSAEDQSLTTKFATAGKLLELPLLDHIIVTNEGYTSFCDEGLLHCDP